MKEPKVILVLIQMIPSSLTYPFEFSLLVGPYCLISEIMESI